MVVAVFVNWMQSFLLDSPQQQPQQAEEELLAVPGLVTLLDQAMLETVQPQLTATLTALHALLAAWLDLKRMAKQALSASHNGSQEEGVVARVCFDAACDAVERLSTDRLAAFGNLSDPFETISPATTSSLQSTTGTTATDPSLTSTNQSTHGTSLTTTAATWLDSARRQALPQRGRDCWETAILHCPDYVWADDVVLTCLRLIRQLQKTVSNSESFLHNTNHSAFSNRLIHSIQDLVTAVHRFKTSIQADAVVLKRLYLIKCEYRGPLRAFWEAHQAVQRAPALQWVDSALQQRQRNTTLKGNDDDQGTLAKQRLQKLLERPELVESLALEQACERFEVEMAKALYSFAEVARHYGKKTTSSSSTRNHNNSNHGGHMMARHADHPLVTPRVARTLRRLKKCLVRKTGPDTSGGIRPLLLDWQGVRRDDENDDIDMDDKDMDPLQAFEARVTAFCQDLQAVSRLCELRLQQGSSSSGGASSSHDSVLDTIPTTAARECVDLDAELLICQAVDWYACVLRQHELQDTPALNSLSEQVRKAELWLSLAMASEPSLTVVRQRIALIQADREKRFGICQEMVQQVCWREMNWKVRLTAPDPMTVLSLSSTTTLSSKGVLQIPLTRAGETIPLG